MTCNNLHPSLQFAASINKRAEEFHRKDLPTRKHLKELLPSGDLPEGEYLMDTIGGPLKIGAMWTSTSNNIKIGNIPQLWIGATVRETVDTCLTSGCLQCPSWAGGEGGAHDEECYAFKGRVFHGLKSIQRAMLKGKNYTIDYALSRALRFAEYVRITAIGDPCVVTPIEADIMVMKIHNAGLKIIGFTAGWRSAPHWKKYLMASCTSLEEAAEARALGWNPSIVYPVMPEKQSMRLPDGSMALVCKAIWMDKKKNKHVTCNQCGLCGEDNPGIAIIFPQHR